MFNFKGATKLLLALVLVVFVAPGIKAEYAFNNGAGGPNNYQGGITDHASYDDGQVNLYKLFNAFFNLEEGDKYSSSDALFDDRGIISDKWEALDGAYIYGVGKVAMLVHELNFVYTDGMTTVDPVKIATDTLGSDGKMTIETVLSGVGINTALETGEFSMFLKTSLWGSQVGTVETYGATYKERGGDWKDDGLLVHMIALDVTDLMKAMLGDIDSAYMFCWEDLPLFWPDAGLPADWDFQDLVYIMVNVRHESDDYDPSEIPVTPEPATALILLVGLVACPLSRKLRRK